jgi:tRNA1Val (adenine37-N6)-methyltransferase
MPNSYFQFKQFTIYQERCALKVSTDSCIFGAWVAGQIALAERHVANCLDIGAGSGLLMLMMAQQFPGLIHGVEIDPGSYEQATENIAASAWFNRLQLYHNDVKLFAAPNRYDCIISNPPFFENELKSANNRYNFAKHEAGLTLQDLLEVAERNLTVKGQFALLLPFHRVEWFEKLAASHELFVKNKLLIRQTLRHPYFRAALILHRNNNGLQQTEELTIRLRADLYSPGFTALLKPYYLHL